MLIKQNTNP